MNRHIFLSIGTNLGDTGENLREAIRRIWQIPRTQLLSVSSFYQTAPWGKLDQPAFLNAVLKVSTALKPIDFLHCTQKIETAMGRVRHEKWGARLIDIDLLYVVEPPKLGKNKMVAVGSGTPLYMDTAELKLPHPYIKERAFVLVPWCELTPRLKLDGQEIYSYRHSLEIEAQAKQVKKTNILNNPYPFKMIAAVDDEWGIGKNGGLIRHSAEDMARFKEKTEGSLVIMGRKTYESLPERKPLPKRRNLILSRHALHCDEHFDKANSIADVFHIAALERADFGDIDLWVIGGAEIYRALMPYTEEIHLTHFAGTHGADTFFPKDAMKNFKLESETLGKDSSFRVYKREHN